MNPEFKRNLWLEISPTRLMLMAVVLGVIFAITWFAAGDADRPAALAGIAEGLFGVIVGLWGSFKAGRSVADEIRERTWDFQRLSALSPMAMTLGKLFGATSYVWFGGLICLGVAMFGHAAGQDWATAAEMAGKLVLLGVFAHAVALAVSLAVVRRGRGRDRVDAFVFTIAGIVAFQSGSELSGGGMVGTVRRMSADGDAMQATQWWGVSLPWETWGYISLGVLVVWAFLTAWRLMRVELQAPANPLWYPLFLLAPALLLGGLADNTLGRLISVYAIVHGLVLATLLVEPKDFVAWRALGARLRTGAKGAGRYWPSAFSGLIVAFLAACALAVVAFVAPGVQEKPVSWLVGFAAFAFLLRETAIFAFFHLGANQRRGDFAALLTIALLCFAGPAVLGIANLDAANGLFIVQPEAGLTSHLLSIASGLVQAAMFAVMAQARWRGREKALATA
ncbi:MAG: hypothetical protein IV086_08365 [Hyphomonadaceae bacterium]|nr:MAG: hypothetical protein FD160_616 [Caulobacteraceae bacterium]MBT9445696.1 hypothetical protein [Hyphomonadaceae bacterium]TPW08343.1 MAG: hypothetical protein FD124_482 [Alphaproteobacteria bacterium]